MLAMGDAQRIGLKVADLGGEHLVGGIGGTQPCFRESLTFAFLDIEPAPSNNRVVVYHIVGGFMSNLDRRCAML